ncbi:MAG: endonuclease/exonuclease/phosphatase family protein [Nocardioides sp.]
MTAVVLVAGLAIALLATIRISASGEGSSTADLAGLSDRVAGGSSSSGTPSATTEAGSEAGSGATPAVADEPEPVKRKRLVPAQKVLKATTLKPKPPEVIEQERVERIAARAAEAGPFDVAIGSFNVLGSQHTAPGGDRRRYPPASVRSPAAASLILAHGVDVVGTQELQADQLAAVQSRTGMAAYPGTAWGSAETDNSILYDSGRFEMVSGRSFTLPFMGRPRPQPILRLRERQTGREFYVVNSHLSAGGGRYLTERRQGQATLVSIMRELRASGLPVLLTGDMNDREEFYCRVVSPAALLASNGGGAGCAPPPSPIPVDWVVGSGVTWSAYRRDTSPVTRRISDHYFISATAHVA